MKLIITKKSIYGNELFYPICENSKILLSLMNKKTFNRIELSKIKLLGYEIELQSEVI